MNAVLIRPPEMEVSGQYPQGEIPRHPGLCYGQGLFVLDLQ